MREGGDNIAQWNRLESDSSDKKGDRRLRRGDRRTSLSYLRPVELTHKNSPRRPGRGRRERQRGIHRDLTVARHRMAP